MTSNEFPAQRRSMNGITQHTFTMPCIHQFVKSRSEFSVVGVALIFGELINLLCRSNAVSIQSFISQFAPCFENANRQGIGKPGSDEVSRPFLLPMRKFAVMALYLLV